MQTIIGISFSLIIIRIDHVDKDDNMSHNASSGSHRVFVPMGTRHHVDQHNQRTGASFLDSPTLASFGDLAMGSMDADGHKESDIGDGNECA